MFRSSRYFLAREMSMKLEDIRTEISQSAQSLNKQMKVAADTAQQNTFREYVRRTQSKKEVDKNR